MIPVTRSERWSGALVASGMAAIVLVPAAVVLAASCIRDGTLTLEAYAPLWQSARPWRLMWNSLCVAGGTAVVAGALGTVYAVAVRSVRPALARVLLPLGVIPLLIPPYVAATAWIEWAGRRGVVRTVVMGAEPGEGAWWSLYGVGGAIAVLATSYFPIVTLFAWSAMGRVRRSLLEASWTHMHARKALWRVLLPNAKGAIATGAFMVFMIALANYSVPSLLLVEVYPVEVHTQFSAFYDVPRAAAAGLPLILLAGCGALAWRWVVGRQASVPSHAGQPTLRWHAGVHPGTGAVVALTLILSVVAPLLVLMQRAGGWTSYTEVFATAGDELWASTVLAATGATVLVAVGWTAAWFTHASRTMRWTVCGLIMPFVLSGPLFGIGLIMLYNHPGARAHIYDSMAIVVLACVARYLFFAVQAGTASLHTVPPALFEAAAVAGQPWWRRAIALGWPLTAHWAVAAWGVAFILVFSEADAIVLIAPPGFTPLPARLHSLMHYGPSAYVAAMSVTVVALLMGAALVSWSVFWLLARRRRPSERL